MACIIAEFLLFSITLAPLADNRRQGRVPASPGQGAELGAVMHLLFEIFHANMVKIRYRKKDRT